ncbi:uncharacterized protein LOC125236072 [Leguminivora glycinivorella]|uniref:uncharacterized protein LOC125236072 n=1 Tax=Leguminivora glycinivorella TaxID=1035111 RepID=UPI00200E46C1|nr:uncharacterized protein LOC125236072 [Leguminivora glycinivorella]
MCQTVKESVHKQQYADTQKSQPKTKMEPVKLEKTVEICPLDCPCRQKTSSYLPLLFNILGILFAVFATYMMITTDSNLYLIFWICYSVLRRMMGKNKGLKMKKD